MRAADDGITSSESAGLAMVSNCDESTRNVRPPYENGASPKACERVTEALKQRGERAGVSARQDTPTETG